MRIGELLVDIGMMSDEQLKQTLDEQKNTGEKLGDISIRKGFINTGDLAKILAKQFGIPYVDVKTIYKSINQQIIDSISKDTVKLFNILPIDIKNNTVTIATATLLSQQIINILESSIKYSIKCMIAPKDDILEAIEYCYNNNMEKNEDIVNAKMSNISGKEMYKIFCPHCKEVFLISPPNLIKQKDRRSKPRT